MIYFDNGATSFPKPPAVEEAVVAAMRRYGANPGRSGHQMSLDAAIKVYECREAAASLFGAAEPEHVVFTQNCTHAVNLAIKGALRRDDHVIISDLEHNSILRPVHTLAERGIITYSVATVSEDEEETLHNFTQLIQPNTRMIACTHGSNVWGIRLPIRKLGQLAAHCGILFLVDAAQTAGVVEIDMARDNIDFLCAAGHKSLYGPTGTGLLITARGSELATLIEGGTGTMSADYGQPADMPERLESGTINTMGILGLGAGIGYVKKMTIPVIYNHEMKLGTLIRQRLEAIRGVRLYTRTYEKGVHLPVISFNIGGMSSEEVVEKLSEKGFALRGGLHCAPLAHRKMDTLRTGAARISIGAFNNTEQSLHLCKAIEQVAARR
jgi:cysteine desulfurase family protein